MSYLTLLNGVPDFTKAVISFWFRVPQASMDKARAIYGSNSDPLSLNNGIIPLLVMGKHGTGQLPYQSKYQSADQSTWDQLLRYTITGNYIAGDYNIDGPNLDCSWQPFPTPTLIYQPNNPFVVTGPAPLADPTYIGVDPNGNLYVQFQTAQAPDVVGWDWYLTDITPGSEVNAISFYGGFAFHDGELQGSGGTNNNDPFIYYSEQFYFWKGGAGLGTKVYAPGGHDITLFEEHYADIDGAPTGVITNDGFQRVTADHWHHVLISVDLQTMASRGAADQYEDTNVPAINFVSGMSKLYIAVDDVNYTQDGLSGEWLPGGGDNDVLTQEAVSIAGRTIATDDRLNDLAMASYTLTDPKVPASGQAVGIPATAEFVNGIYKVEIAELQIFTGVVLDTGIEGNRRLFITAPNKNGVQFPVNPSPITVPLSKSAVGDPTTWEPGADTSAFVPGLFDPSGAPTSNKTLGTADVDFTKSSLNWMMGRNLGKAKGEVVKTGKIKAYFPDPKLGGQ